MTDFKLTTRYNSDTENLPNAVSPDFFTIGFNDLELDTNGDIKVTTSTSKLAQDILKFIVTKPGTEPYFQNYGMDFDDLIGQPMKDGTESYIQAQIKDRVKTGLIELQSTLRDRPDNEQIGAITYFSTTVTTDEVQVKFTVLTKSMEVFNIFVGIS